MKHMKKHVFRHTNMQTHIQSIQAEPFTWMADKPSTRRLFIQNNTTYRDGDGNGVGDGDGGGTGTGTYIQVASGIRTQNIPFQFSSDSRLYDSLDRRP